MTKPEKVALVQMFLRGADVKGCAIFFACAHGTVERVLREAITQLSDLNTQIAERIPQSHVGTEGPDPDMTPKEAA